MLTIRIDKDENGQRILKTSVEGKALLTIPQLNKGTAFTEKERTAFELIGKLPTRIETLEEQVERAYAQYKSYEDRLNRNIHLNNLLNTNQVLFFALIKAHLQEMLPTIYTPIVGKAVKNYSAKFTQPRGLYISYEDREHIETILKNRSNPDIRLIVVSDGEGVLGIGDQGVGGIEIPIAKLMVYSAVGGVNPMHTLPILLDAGTNNEKLLKDPFYLGWRHRRISGKDYDDFIARFVAAIKKVFSENPYLHWEDFGKHNAQRNLKAYREQICSFNDDIQGTGVVAVAALIAALKRTQANLREQRIMIFGAGTAGIGVTDSICRTLQREGLSENEARRCFWLIDRAGLMVSGVGEPTDAQTPYLRDPREVVDWAKGEDGFVTFSEAMARVKPTVLIGCSGVGGAFDKEIVTTMAQHATRPIIFPLSNPTDRAEATPEHLLRWTQGQAIIATGSPFKDVSFNNKTYAISQCNNFFAFPGIGLGVITIGATCVTDNMLAAASDALSRFLPEDSERLLPTTAQASEASKAIACAVAKAACDDGVASRDPKPNVDQWIESHYWEPRYLPYEPIK